jgi:hypothetical protein
MRPTDDLPGVPLTLAIMLGMLALVAIPVALACYHVASKLPALRAILAAQGG